jgi:hypothetical protein
MLSVVFLILLEYEQLRNPLSSSDFFVNIIFFFYFASIAIISACFVYFA